MKNVPQDVNKKLSAAVLPGLLSAFLIGIVLGVARRIFHLDLIVLLNGLLVGLMIQYISNGMYRRFSLLGVGCALFSIIISDVVYFYNLSGLLNLASYSAVFKVIFVEDISSLLWLIYRIGALALAYAYSRSI